MHAQGLLPTQPEIAYSIASTIARTPAAPECLDRLATDLARGFTAVADSHSGRGALEALRDALFVAPGREREALALWRESVATAACAELLAPARNASVAVATLGALLHRAADAWMLRVIARSERETESRLDGAARARLAARESASCAARLVREWKLAAPVASCMLGWRQCGEISSVSAEAVVVYCARMLAIELLQPDVCVPGALDAAAEEYGLDAAALARVRARGTDLLSLVNRFG